MTTRSRLTSSASEMPQVEKRETVQSREDSDDTDSDAGEWKQVKNKSKRNLKHICKGGKKPCGLSTEKDQSIECNGCLGWYHPACQDLSIGAFKALGKYDLFWLCLDCKENVTRLLDIERKVGERIEQAEKNIIEAMKMVHSVKDSETKDKIEEKIEQMEKSVVSKITEQQSEVVTTLKSQQSVLKNIPQVSEELKSSTDTFKKMIKSQEDETRKHNIIIHNVQESTSEDPAKRKEDDLKVFTGIASALLGEGEAVSVDQVIRLGKKNESGKPRLMLVRVKDRNVVEQLYKKRFRLKDEGFQNTYLTRDLTPEEREVQKKLREELARKGKETHKIFRGAVIPREEATN